MNPLEQQNAAEELTGIYIDLESRIMQNIIRHIQTWKEPIDSDDWQMQCLAEIGKLDKEHIRIIAKSSGLSQTAIERMLQEAAENALEAVEPGLAELARKSILGEAIAAEKSQRIKQVLKNYRRQAKDILNQCNTTMLYRARDAFEKLVTDTASVAKEIAERQAYLDILNRNTAAVVTGVDARQQAMVRTIREFNERGIPVFMDRRGREWTPEAYVNMCIRSTAGSVANETQMARCEDYGINLVQVDSHSGARPKCARDQGKIFDLNNKSEKYPHWNTSSYGEPDGLLGINCGHHIYPFVEGVNIRRYFPTEDLDANDKRYKEIQGQRALERAVRKQKRECMLYDQADNKDAFENASVKLKQKEERLIQYTKDKKLPRRKNREEVVGFGKGTSARAVAANKAYTKAQETDTIPIKDTYIRKGVGAKARNYKVVDKATGVEYEFAGGTKIQNSEVFAGKGTRHPLHEGVAEGLTAQYGGTVSKWQHAKGIGVLVDQETGEEFRAEVHWFQEETVGKVQFKLKREINDES